MLTRIYFTLTLNPNHLMPSLLNSVFTAYHNSVESINCFVKALRKIQRMKSVTSWEHGAGQK